MFGFIIKKSFFDGWDNLYSLVIANIITVAVTLGMGIVVSMAISTSNGYLVSAAVVAISILISICVFAYGNCAADIANYKSVKIVDFFKNIPSVLLDASLFGLMLALIGIVSFIGVTYYWSEEFLSKFSVTGIFLGSFILWADLFIIIALEWFVPIRSLMKNNFLKCLKKSFIIFFDNTGFSLLMFIHNIAFGVVSVFCMGLVPSFSGLQIATVNALRLRLYKYDYLEQHPELLEKLHRPSIPWEELIYDDRETVGNRKLKSIFFPWKDKDGLN